jgi:hypothetical protein
MLTRTLKPIAVRSITNIHMIDSLGYKSHSSSEVQHGSHHDEVRRKLARI